MRLISPCTYVPDPREPLGCESPCKCQPHILLVDLVDAIIKLAISSQTSRRSTRARKSLPDNERSRGAASFSSWSATGSKLLFVPSDIRRRHTFRRRRDFANEANSR